MRSQNKVESQLTNASRDLNTSVLLPRATLAHRLCGHGDGIQKQLRDHFSLPGKAGLVHFGSEVKALPAQVKSSPWEKGTLY